MIAPQGGDGRGAGRRGGERRVQPRPEVRPLLADAGDAGDRRLGERLAGVECPGDDQAERLGRQARRQIGDEGGVEVGGLGAKDRRSAAS